jgi:tetratricopeptide (TPR) repeat protein
MSLSQAQLWKDAGDRYYRSGSYASAIEEYSNAIACLSSGLDQNLLYICYSNRSACFLQLKRYQEALYDAQQCVSIKPDWSKGYLRLGKSYYRLGKDSDAIAAYEQLLSLDPYNQEAYTLLNQLRSGGSNGRSGQDNEGGFAQAHTYPQSLRQYFTNLFTSSQQYLQSINWSGIGEKVKSALGRATSQGYMYWLRLDEQTRNYVQIGAVFFLLYYFFIYRSSYSSPYYYDSGPGYQYYGGGGGLSWTSWAMVMYGAYKLPPMFPEQLGIYLE